MQTAAKRQLTIWSFVGFILMIYGALIFGMGIYYLFEPPVKIALSHLHPSLWWGLLMLVTGFIFNYFDSRNN